MEGFEAFERFLNALTVAVLAAPREFPAIDAAVDAAFAVKMDAD